MHESNTIFLNIQQISIKIMKNKIFSEVKGETAFMTMIELTEMQLIIFIKFNNILEKHYS